MPDRFDPSLPSDIAQVFDLVNRLTAEEGGAQTALTTRTTSGLVLSEHSKLLLKAQTALRQSEDRFRTLIEKDTHIIALLSAGGTVLYDSPSVTAILGYTSSELVGQNVFEYIHPEDQGRAGEIFAQLRTGPRKPVTVVMRYRHKDGGYRSLEGTGTNFLGEPAVKALVFDFQDVTERNQAEVALRESEKRFRQLVHALPAAIYTCDAQGRITLYNEAAVRLWGRRPEIEVDRWSGAWRLLELDGTLIAHAESSMAQAVREGRSVRDTEMIIERPDGSRSHVLPYPDPIHSESGEVVGGVNLLVDLTEPKRAIAQLRESQQWLKAIFEQAAVGVSQTDMATGRFIRVNQRFCDIVGYTAAEMEQLSFPEITHEQDVSMDLDDMEQLRTGAIREFAREKRYVRKDGSIIWVSLAVSAIGVIGEAPTSFIAVAQDISSRRQAERETQRQAAFARLNPDPVLELSASGEVTYCNEAAREMARALGAESPEQILPANIATIVGDCLASAAPSRLETQAKDRTIAWLFFPVPSSQVVHCSAGDVTAHKRLEAHFLQAQKMEALGQFSGGVAHDFNNILAVILGYVELSQMALKDNPKVSSHLGSVLQAVGRATDLVRQILTFSRQQPQERMPIRLQPVVVESLKLLRATIPSTIDFRSAISPDAPTVLANANQVHQILMNLGVNAWHAMRESTGRIEISLEEWEVDAVQVRAHPELVPGAYARLSVSDTGCGMDPATLRRIFEPFYTTKPAGEGTGLGLSVVHGIMDSHDGSVTVESERGKGTTFYLYFPLHAGEVEVSVPVETETPCGQGERILVVDDEILLATLAQQALITLGYDVEVATRPAEALALVTADPQRFALVVTDLTMPGMTGLHLATQLSLIRPGLPMILMTGYSASITADRMAAAGVSRLLLKPASIRELARAVHEVLAKRTVPSVLPA